MAVEADNSEYWDKLAIALAKVIDDAAHPLYSTTPAFGGYVAVPNNHGDADFFAWWGDGKLAVWNPVTSHWQAHRSPVYDKLFPASPSAPFVTAPSNPTVGEGPRPEADQPRPDDADETEYPRTRRGRDD
jgi:hypothetical protein